MTTEERIAALEARIAQLEARMAQMERNGYQHQPPPVFVPYVGDPTVWPRPYTVTCSGDGLAFNNEAVWWVDPNSGQIGA